MSLTLAIAVKKRMDSKSKGSDNEKLDPEHEPDHSMRLGKIGLKHMGIVQGVMKKMAKMASGGMVDEKENSNSQKVGESFQKAGDYLQDEGYESDPNKKNMYDPMAHEENPYHASWPKGSYAEGGEVPESHMESPFSDKNEDFLNSEKQTPLSQQHMPEGLEEKRDDVMKRKAIIAKVMGSIRAKNMGKK